MFKMHPESVRYRLKELERNKYVAPNEILDMHDKFVDSLTTGVKDE